MADYKNIKGFNIQYLDSDPPNPIEGQMWFNSTTQTLKGAEVGGAPIGTWASGGNMINATDSLAGYGTQSAAGAVSGRTAPTTGITDNEHYDGTSWTEVADCNQARWLAASSGSQTAALLHAGAYPGSGNPVLNVESWNGTSWTEVADVNTAKRSHGGAGTQTAALSYAGRMAGTSPDYKANTESWNGTSWTEVADLSTARAYMSGSGTQTDAIYAGGYNPVGVVNLVEFWNGTSWTEVAELNTARNSNSSSGTSTNAITMGGYTTVNVTNTESWNGTAWTELADLATARSDAASAGSGSNASSLYFGGYGAPYLASTEEWTAPDISVKTFTTS